MGRRLWSGNTPADGPFLFGATMRVDNFQEADGCNTPTEGEVARWEIHHSQEAINAEGNPDKDATFIRLTQRAPYLSTTYLALFAETDPAGMPRISMNLWPELLDQLIDDLQDARRIANEAIAAVKAEG